MIFQVEKWRDVVEEIKPILSLHHAENANFKDAVPLAVDWVLYQQMADAGTLQVLTVREDEKLVGYYVSNVLHHPHYQTTLYSFNDAYFLLPEYRNASAGLLLLEAYEDAMVNLAKRRGAERIVLVGRSRIQNRTAVLFDRLGWDRVEICHTKKFEIDN